MEENEKIIDVDCKEVPLVEKLKHYIGTRELSLDFDFNVDNEVSGLRIRDNDKNDLIVSGDETTNFAMIYAITPRVLRTSSGVLEVYLGDTKIGVYVDKK